MELILASKSVPRKRALDILGLKYEVVTSNIDEKTIRDNNPIELVKKLSEAKARQVGEENINSLVIGGDLIVFSNEKIYEKPVDENDAINMLNSFSENWISIIGGVAVYNSITKKIYSAVEEYRVKFRKLTDYEIKDYMKRYPALHCSGAFEGDGLFRFAETAEGKYPFTSQITFPMNKLIDFLREEGVLV